MYQFYLRLQHNVTTFDTSRHTLDLQTHTMIYKHTHIFTLLGFHTFKPTYMGHSNLKKREHTVPGHPDHNIVTQTTTILDTRSNLGQTQEYSVHNRSQTKTKHRSQTTSHRATQTTSQTTRSDPSLTLWKSQHSDTYSKIQ